MSDAPHHVLFLCTGNSARSIMAEAILDRLGGGRFVAHSAGSHPKGKVHPHALMLLERENYPTGDLRSKSWDEFSGPEAPPLDFVITVCGNAADEVCPVWHGGPMTAHWGIPDPASVMDDDAQMRAAFETAYGRLHARITAFLDLPIDTLDASALQQRMREIGEATPDPVTESV